MEIVNLIINAVLLIGFAVAVLLFRRYVPAYLEEKGKNSATKEDIGQITAEIERVKAEYAQKLEILRYELRFDSGLREAFREKSMEALESINNVLVKITKYCWAEMAKMSPNEHYVYSSVDDSEEQWGFHYFRVAIDKSILENEFYLSENMVRSLSELSDRIGLLSSMELGLMKDDPHPAVIESAEDGYAAALNAVRKCRQELFAEFKFMPPTINEGDVGAS